MAEPSAGENQDAGTRSGPRLELILTSAASLMARNGYGQTSIRDVARETKLSLAGMYYYFQSKEDLLYKIQHRTFASLLEEQEAVAAVDLDGRERLRRLIGTHLSYYTSHFNEMKICTFELQSLTGDRYREVEELRRRYYRLAAGIVGEILDSGGTAREREAEARHYTLFIFGMLNWIFMWFDPERDAPLEDLSERLVRLALHGLAGTPAPPA
jgi:TetR/AcrR family transcriptional regulator